MSSRLLRSAGPVPVEPAVAVVAPALETCAICLDTLDPNDPNVSTHDCKHCFHATCLVPHVLKDPRCPCCRAPPRDYIYPDDLYDDDQRSYLLDDDAPCGPTFKQAMANVRSDAKTDKRVARQLETVKKWKTAKKDAQREARKLAEKLRPLEDKLQIELDIHTKKRWATFDAKHASLIAAHKEAAKLAQKATTQYRSSKHRVARKGGWGCSSYRDVLRSPNEHEDEQDDT